MKKILPRFPDFAKLNEEISKAWDANVVLRAKDILGRTDYSYTKVIEPWALDEILTNTTEDSIILDVGCGCGYLAGQMHKNGRKNIVGIDISEKSIKYAKQLHPDVEFIHNNIYEFVYERQIDLCTAIMVFNNLPDVDLCMNRINKIMKSDGILVVVIPHPCFWPAKHISDLKFDYLKEEKYKIKFATKGEKNYPSDILYFHRPLELYFDCFTANGFDVERFVELPERDEMVNPDMLGIVLKKKRIL